MSTQETTDYSYNITNVLEKPIVIVVFVFLVVVYMIYIYVSNPSIKSSNTDYYDAFNVENEVYPLSDSYSSENSVSSGIFAKIIVFVFIGIIVVKGYQILFNKTITASIQDLFTNEPKVSIHVNTNEPPPPESTQSYTPVLDKYGLEPVNLTKSVINQVFNVPGIFIHMIMPKPCVKHMMVDWQLMMKLKTHTKRAVNGVIMDGQRDKMHIFPPKKLHIIIFKP